MRLMEVEVCLLGFLFVFTILLRTNFPDYLNRIIIKLLLGSLKDLNVPVCLMHEIHMHTYKIHIHTKTKQIIYMNYETTHINFRSIQK